MITLVPSSFSSLVHSLFITWLCLLVWLTVPGYCGIQDPRIPCRLRPRILPVENRERLDHSWWQRNYIWFQKAMNPRMSTTKWWSIATWPTLPSHLLPRSDLIFSLLIQYHSNPLNLVVFNVTFILFVEYVQLHFYSQLNESLLSNLQQLVCKPFFIDMPDVSKRLMLWFNFILGFNFISFIHYHTPKQEK